MMKWTMMKTLRNVLVLVAVLALAAPASATIILSDGFDYALGNLAGNTAPTGQTWGARPFGDKELQVDDITGTPSGKGAGSLANGKMYAGQIELGTTLTDQIVVFSFDMYREGAYVTAQYAALLYDDVNGTYVGLNMWDSTTALNIVFKAPTKSTVTLTVPETERLHLEISVDLDNKTVTASWEDLVGLTSGSQYIGTYTGTYQPHRFQPYSKGRNHWQAYDNVLVEQIPEPATLAVLSIGALLALLKRRRA